MPNFDLPGWRGKFYQNDPILIANMVKICHTIRKLEKIDHLVSLPLPNMVQCTKYLVVMCITVQHGKVQYGSIQCTAWHYKCVEACSAV